MNDEVKIMLAEVFFDKVAVFSRIFRGGTKESLECKDRLALETEIWTRNMFRLQPTPRSPRAA